MRSRQKRRSYNFRPVNELLFLLEMAEAIAARWKVFSPHERLHTKQEISSNISTIGSGVIDLMATLSR